MIDLKPDTVARLVDEGLNHRQIAQRLNVSEALITQRMKLWLAQQRAASPKTAQAVQNLRKRTA